MFNDETLTRLWNELVKDEEIVTDVSLLLRESATKESPKPPQSQNEKDEQDKEKEKEEDQTKENAEKEKEVAEEESDEEKMEKKRSGFLPILEEWTWGEVSRMLY